MENLILWIVLKDRACSNNLMISRSKYIVTSHLEWAVKEAADPVLTVNIVSYKRAVISILINSNFLLEV